MDEDFHIMPDMKMKPLFSEHFGEDLINALHRISNQIAIVAEKISDVAETLAELKTKAEAEKKPEPASEPAPERRDILEAKKEKYLRILIAEFHTMKKTLQHPFTVGAAIYNTSNICQAACDLGEVVFELEQLEKGEKGKK